MKTHWHNIRTSLAIAYDFRYKLNYVGLVSGVVIHHHANQKCREDLYLKYLLTYNELEFITKFHLRYFNKNNFTQNISTDFYGPVVLKCKRLLKLGRP